MDFKAIMKKYWFVCVVGVLLVAFIGVYAKDAYDNRELTVGSKQIDGQYAVYSIDGEYVFADEFFDSLYNQNGLSVAFMQFQREVLNGAYETTDEISDTASSYAAYVYQYYGEDAVNDDLKQMGYVNGAEDLTQYYIDAQKQSLLLNDYLSANWDSYITTYEEYETPVLVKQILVKVADVTTDTDADGNTVYVANPTEEEQANLDAVLADLAAGKDFDEVQEQYNEDGSNDSYLVSSNTSSNYVSIFSNTSLALAEEQVSEAVTSNYGYHIIKRIKADKEAYLANSSFLTELEEYFPNLNLEAVMDKANELGYTVVDEDLNDLISQQLESEDAE